MWRAFFWSIGISACLLGAQCLVIEKAILNSEQPAAVSTRGRVLSQQREIAVPDWAPWTLFAFGAITLIYTVTIPKRAYGD